MLMQTFGGQTKSIMVFLKVAYKNSTDIEPGKAISLKKSASRAR